MSAQREAFLAAIAETPDDDTPRLVFADWLEDHGDPERAAFVRLQCALAKLAEDDPRREGMLDEEARLLALHEDEWLADLPDAIRYGIHKGLEFRRGFLTTARLTAPEFLEHGDVLFRGAPIEDLWLEYVVRTTAPTHDLTAEVLASPHLGRLRRLQLESCQFRLLGESPHLRGLRDLDLGSNNLDEAVLEAIAELPSLERLRFGCRDLGPECFEKFLASPAGGRLRSLRLFGGPRDKEAVARLVLSNNWLPALRELELPGMGLSSGFVEWMASLPRLGRLERLTLHQNEIGEPGVVALARSRHVGGLRHLDLSWLQLMPGGLAALGASEALAELEELKITNSAGTGMGPTHVGALTSGVALRGLRRLDLSGQVLGDAGAAALASWECLKGIRRLDLVENGIGDAGAIALASSPHAAGIEDLRICRNAIGDAGLIALATSPVRMRELEADSPALTAAGVRALAASPNARRLGRLDLNSKNVGDAGAVAIANSPYLANLRILWLGECGIGPAGGRALAESPHLGRLRSLLLFHNDLGDSLPLLRARFGGALRA